MTAFLQSDWAATIVAASTIDGIHTLYVSPVFLQRSGYIVRILSKDYY